MSKSKALKTMKAGSYVNGVLQKPSKEYSPRTETSHKKHNYTDKHEQESTYRHMQGYR